MNTFSSSACITYGWETFKKRPWFFIGVYAVIGIVSGRYNFGAGDPNAQVPASVVIGLVVLGIALVVLQMIIRMGEKRLLLNAYSNVESASFYDLWTRHPFWRYVGGNVLTGLIVVDGLILLIVPGIIWAIQYMFVNYLIIDRGLKPMEALRESARITNGHKWELFQLGLTLIGINILGLLCLGVGLLVSIPVSQLAVVNAYRALGQAAGETTAATA